MFRGCCGNPGCGGGFGEVVAVWVVGVTACGYTVYVCDLTYKVVVQGQITGTDWCACCGNERVAPETVINITGVGDL